MNNSNNKMESNGAIWKGKTKGGSEKLSIIITIDDKKYNLIAFPNSFKTAENQPDYRIFLSQQGQSNTPKQASTQQEPVAKQQSIEDDFGTEEEPTDIPF